MIFDRQFPEQMRFGDGTGRVVRDAALKFPTGESVAEALDILPDGIVQVG